MIGIHVHDPRDKSLPNIGLIKIQDSESGKERWIDTDNKSFQKKYQQFSSFEQQTKDFFTKCGSSLLSIRISIEDYVKKLQLFFKSRIR